MPGYLGDTSFGDSSIAQPIVFVPAMNAYVGEEL
jgi:hypothetical protein